MCVCWGGLSQLQEMHLQLGGGPTIQFNVDPIYNEKSSDPTCDGSVLYICPLDPPLQTPVASLEGLAIYLRVQ